jgi:uncharacterized protein YuzE
VDIVGKGEITALGAEKVDVEYDKEADMFYISFSSNTPADDSELTDNDIIIRYRDKRVFSLKMLHFSKRHKPKSD